MFIKFLEIKFASESVKVNLMQIQLKGNTRNFVIPVIKKNALI